MHLMKIRKLIASALSLVVASGLSGCAHSPAAQEPRAEIGPVEIEPDLTLRRMVVRNPQARGTVLLLHGFPETVYAWESISLALGRDYEVHAFDWPGFGLSSRPGVDTFGYAPSDYARVLKEYIEINAIDTSSLTIYATDIGALPALLLALEKPDIARTIIVGDFAPFDRPEYMYESLRMLKSKATSEAARAYLNQNRDDILENIFRRGLPAEAQFEIPQAFKDDMARGWNHGEMTSADAFYHYYANFTRDQNYFESHLDRLATPVRIVWGDKDLYIDKQMGIELARKAHLELTLLPGVGHHPHLQAPRRTIEEIRLSLGGK
jgi:pimeloyl-ACP methyl ester carboxylesterase